MKLKGNTFVWMYAVATWVWFGSASGRSLMLEDNNIIYPTVRFTTAGATEESYDTFIDQVRRNLPSQIPDNNRTYGIPMLQNDNQVPTNRRYVLVELTNQGGQIVTFGVDVTNLYLVAYRVGNDAYFFRDATGPITSLFNESTITRHTINFPFTYGGLEDIARATRGNIPLGTQPLENAISNIFYYPSGSTNRPALARNFIICAQMISEAVRFQYIERFVGERIENGELAPDPSIITYENNWDRISNSIESSGRGGAFRPITLQHPDGSTYIEDNVQALIGIIALLVYKCAPQSSSQLSLLIRQVVPNLINDACVEYEPTGLIIGLNGQCVDVHNNRYENGNPIDLWTCHSEPNQIWTLKNDGTIQCNGMCLTACSDIPGSYVMIFDCSTAAADAIHWQVSNDRTIVNSKSGLVLTATSADKGTTLTVETNIHATNQAWFASNNKQPSVTFIVGLNDFCLTSSDLHFYQYCNKYKGDAWIEKCDSTKTEQLWAIYPDGSLRPQKNLDYCLTGDANVEEGIVRILSCSLGSPGQRWVSKSDGTIWNLYYGLVLEVKDSNPNLKKLIIAPFTGKPNQIWIRLLK